MLNVLLTTKFRPAILGACRRGDPSLKIAIGQRVRGLSTPGQIRANGDLHHSARAGHAVPSNGQKRICLWSGGKNAKSVLSVRLRGQRRQGVCTETLGVVDPPYRSSALWRRHDGSVARARLAPSPPSRSGCQGARVGTLHIVSTPFLVPTTTGRRQARKSGFSPEREAGAKRCIGIQRIPSCSRTTPPPACTKAIPAATSQIFGEEKRATSRSPAATSAHRSAAGPFCRVPQPASSACAATGPPAKRRSTSAFTLGVTSLPSKRNLRPSEAW